MMPHPIITQPAPMPPLPCTPRSLSQQLDTANGLWGSVVDAARRGSVTLNDLSTFIHELVADYALLTRVLYDIDAQLRDGTFRIRDANAAWRDVMAINRDFSNKTTRTPMTGARFLCAFNGFIAELVQDVPTRERLEQDFEMRLRNESPKEQGRLV